MFTFLEASKGSSCFSGKYSRTAARYYSHCHIMTGEDYMKGSTTTSLGKGNKTDFGKLGEGGRNARVGPCTSAEDGEEDRKHFDDVHPY